VERFEDFKIGAEKATDQRKYASSPAELRVLVVEDNIIHITLLVEQLTVKMGIPESKITCAFDCQEALAKISENLLQNLNDPS
jgi:hypothetical protein